MDNLMSTADMVLDELIKITGTDEVRQNLDLLLFDEDVLDSLGAVELVVALGEAFNLDLSPAQVDRKSWATPRAIILDIENRIQAGTSGAR
jgi:D-alanine--poly(phosphoribitol) ligase subunit 2